MRNIIFNVWNMIKYNEFKSENENDNWMDLKNINYL